jgi:HSP20 family protein
MKSLMPWKKTETVDDPVRSLHRAVNQLFNDFFVSFDLAPFGMLEGGTFAPSINMHEDDKNIRITAELPGMDAESIEINLSRDSLTLAGEKRAEKEESSQESYYMERTFGSFRRTIPLPAVIDRDKAEAEFKNGVLTITLPKLAAPTEEVRKIKIRN